MPAQITYVQEARMEINCFVYNVILHSIQRLKGTVWMSSQTAERTYYILWIVKHVSLLISFLRLVVSHSSFTYFFFVFFFCTFRLSIRTAIVDLRRSSHTQFFSHNNIRSKSYVFVLDTTLLYMLLCRNHAFAELFNDLYPFISHVTMDISAHGIWFASSHWSLIQWRL